MTTDFSSNSSQKEVTQYSKEREKKFNPKFNILKKYQPQMKTENKRICHNQLINRIVLILLLFQMEQMHILTTLVMYL